MTHDYAAELLRVVDADTLDLRVSREIDFGFYLIERKSWSSRFRLFGVDAPDRDHPTERQLATNYASAWLAGRRDRLRVETYKPDNFGRWLCVPYVDGDRADNLPDALVAAGLAVPYRRRDRPSSRLP